MFSSGFASIFNCGCSRLRSLPPGTLRALPPGGEPLGEAPEAEGELDPADLRLARPGRTTNVGRLREAPGTLFGGLRHTAGAQIQLRL